MQEKTLNNTLKQTQKLGGKKEIKKERAKGNASRDK